MTNPIKCRIIFRILMIFRDRFWWQSPYKSFVHYSHTTIEAFFQDILVILKHSLQNYYKILMEYFLGTTYIVIVTSLAYSNFQLQRSELLVAKSILNFILKSLIIIVDVIVFIIKFTLATSKRIERGGYKIMKYISAIKQLLWN